MKNKNKQLNFCDIGDNEEFDKDNYWKEHWKNMPEYISEDLTSFSSIIVHFSSLEDLQKFSDLVGQKITTKTQSIWFPKAEIRSFKNKIYVTSGYKNGK